MSKTVSEFPLLWPPGFSRAKSREKGQFKTTLTGALNNVNDSLRKFANDSGKKLESLVMSSNVTLGTNNPSDPGVAVWFVWDGISVCIAVDRYHRVEANLQAIHHIIEARRTELRHGTLALVRATFQGFRAIPDMSAPKYNWRAVIGVDETEKDLSVIRRVYKKKAAEIHPDRAKPEDKADATEAMTALNAAMDAALKELGD